MHEARGNHAGRDLRLRGGPFLRIAPFLLIAAAAAGGRVKVLIVDGQNNHA